MAPLTLLGPPWQAPHSTPSQARHCHGQTASSAAHRARPPLQGPGAGSPSTCQAHEGRGYLELLAKLFRKLRRLRPEGGSVLTRGTQLPGTAHLQMRPSPLHQEVQIRASPPPASHLHHHSVRRATRLSTMVSPWAHLSQIPDSQPLPPGGPALRAQPTRNSGGPKPALPCASPPAKTDWSLLPSFEAPLCYKRAGPCDQGVSTGVF